MKDRITIIYAPTAVSGKNRKLKAVREREEYLDNLKCSVFFAAAAVENNICFGIPHVTCFLSLTN